MSPRDQRSERSLGGGGGKYPRDRDRQRERERERDAYYKYNRGSNRDSRDGRNRDRSPKDRKSWQDHRGGRHQVQDRGGGKFLGLKLAQSYNNCNSITVF